MGTHPIFESDFDCLTEKSRPMRFTRVANVMMSRVLREGVKFKLSSTQMHTILGSTDDSSPEQLRELYLARVREIHPDTRTDDAPEIELDELKQIYDDLLERRCDLEEKGSATLTIEDYRAGVHRQKVRKIDYFYSNAFRFWIFIPLMIIMTDMSYDIITECPKKRRKREERISSRRSCLATMTTQVTTIAKPKKMALKKTLNQTFSRWKVSLRRE